jgi:hypothetical protein
MRWGSLAPLLYINPLDLPFAVYKGVATCGGSAWFTGGPTEEV